MTWREQNLIEAVVNAKLSKKKNQVVDGEVCVSIPLDKWNMVIKQIEKYKE